MKFVLSAILLIFSVNAQANTGASAIAMPIGASLFLFPLIVALEWYFYKRAGVLKPFKKSLSLNAISSTIGNFIAIVTMAMPFSPLTGLLYLDSFRGKHNHPGIAYAIILHFCLTVLIEGGFSKLMKWDLNMILILRAHLISYLLITAWATLPKLIFEFL